MTWTTRVALLLVLSSVLFALLGMTSALRSDEVWSIQATSLDYQTMMAQIRQDAHPPLYYQILAVWSGVFGASEIGVRSLSGLFYILSVLAVYILARKLYDPRTAMLCAGLYLTSPLAILYSHFARMYALLSLLSILSTWLYLGFSVRPDNSKKTFLLYISVNALGTFTHIWFFFLLFAQGTCQLLLFPHRRLKRFLAAITLSLVPYAVLWLPAFLSQFSKSGELGAWLTRPGIQDIGSVLLAYGGAVWLMVPVLLYVWWRRRDRSGQVVESVRANVVLLLLLLISLGVPLLISQFKPVFYTRFTIVGLHLYALAAGAAISALIGKAKIQQMLVILVAVTASAMVIDSFQPSPCDSRRTAEYLLEHAGPGDIVIFTSLSRPPIDYYMDQMEPARQMMETSFPAEIDSHPGYEGHIQDAARIPALRREAVRLAERIERLGQGSVEGCIYFLHGYRPKTDKILGVQLDKHFQLEERECVHCRAAPNYYREVSVYRARKTTGVSENPGD